MAQHVQLAQLPLDLTRQKLQNLYCRKKISEILLNINEYVGEADHVSVSVPLWPAVLPAECLLPTATWGGAGPSLQWADQWPGAVLPAA